MTIASSVTNVASSEQSQTTASPISSGRPSSPIGVSMTPGQTALIRIPSLLYSRAAVFVKPMIPNLLATYRLIFATLSCQSGIRIPQFHGGRSNGLYAPKARRCWGYSVRYRHRDHRTVEHSRPISSLSRDCCSIRNPIRVCLFRYVDESDLGHFNSADTEYAGTGRSYRQTPLILVARNRQQKEAPAPGVGGRAVLRRGPRGQRSPGCRR